MVREIVVGVDESDGAADALRWAVREAACHAATVTAVMAWGLLDQHHVAVDETFDPAYGEGDARDALRTFITAAIGEEAATAIRPSVVCDLPARALLDVAASGDLLVVGARGLGGFRGLLLGSVSQHCLHHASVPTAIVRAARDRDDSPAERIVVGVDGSEISLHALRWALEEGRARGAGIEVVHAWQVPYVGYFPHTENRFDPVIHERASDAVLDRALAAVRADELHDVPVRRTSLRSGAAAGIIDLTDDADLVVLGSRGLGAVKGALLGSVTMQVTQHAHCPVVVVPPAE